MKGTKGMKQNKEKNIMQLRKKVIDRDSLIDPGSIFVVSKWKLDPNPNSWMTAKTRVKKFKANDRFLKRVKII